VKVDEFWAYLEELDDMNKREEKPKGIDDQRTRDALFDPRYEVK